MTTVTWRGEALDSELVTVTIPSGSGIEGPITIHGAGEPVERIDSDERGVDDVAIGPVEMVRLERMSKRSWWTAAYLPDGSRHVFWFYASKKGRITVEHRKEAAP